MDGFTTGPHDLQPHDDRRQWFHARRGESGAGNHDPENSPAGSVRHRSEHEDTATTTSRIYFFIMLAIITAALAAFLILRPQ